MHGLTFKQLFRGFEDINLFSNIVYYKWNIYLWNVSIAMHIDQYCGHWWFGAVAINHQLPQCWVRTHAFSDVMWLVIP